MRICVIINEHAGSAGQGRELVEAAAEQEDVVCWQSDRRGGVADLAARAASESMDIVAAAGGDGTVNEVVNGLMRVDRRPALGVIPLGTGNDLARMLDVSLKNPVDALALLRNGQRRTLDTFLMESSSAGSFGINAAAGGFSGQVDEVLTPEIKSNWGPLAYLIGAATALPEIQNYDTYMTLDDGAPEVLRALNIVVANGRTVAGGKRVSPLSNPEDGLLDVVVIRSGTVVELGDVAARLVAGNLAGSRLVTHRRARRVHIESEPGMWFNLDGELLTNEPVQMTAVPEALEVVVGPEYRAEIEP